MVGILVVTAGCAGGQRAKRHPTERLPVVLVHGISGFSSVAGMDYFFQVPAVLREQGYNVHVTSTPPWAPVAVRSRHLAGQVRAILTQTGARRVHLIAHSMGGLDARQAIHDDLGASVATLTTMGTPHRGSPVADQWYQWRMPWLDPARSAAANLHAWTVRSPPEENDPAAALLSLGTEEAVGFNTRNPDHPQVAYYSFAGRTLGHDGAGYCGDAELPNPSEVDLPPPDLIGPAMFLSGPDLSHAIANDGAVQVPSARWGRFMGCLPANHYRLIGHPVRAERIPGTWDHRAFYVQWVEWLMRSTPAAPR